MKTKEELNALKEEVETVSRKLAELSEEELAQVTGGVGNPLRCPKCGNWMSPTYRPMPGAPGVTYRVFVCQNPYCRNEVRG